MTPVPPLAAMGRRIMVCGPSCSGKSKFALLLGQRLGLPVVHLDRLRFLPHSDWRKRPDEAFLALHAEAIASDAWIIEGNYRALVPARLARATGIVELATGNVPTRLIRYVRRTLVERYRAGALEGNRDSLKWAMVRWIAWTEPRRRPIHLAAIRGSGLPLVEIGSFAALDALAEAWGLSAGPSLS